jgi:hypothetical protein
MEITAVCRTNGTGSVFIASSVELNLQLQMRRFGLSLSQYAREHMTTMKWKRVWMFKNKDSMEDIPCYFTVS